MVSLARKTVFWTGSRSSPSAYSSIRLQPIGIFAIPIGMDGKAGAIGTVKLNRAIERPDAMRGFGGQSLLLVEGGGVGRLTRLTIKGDSADITTLEEGFPDGPVSVAVVGTTAYVLEGQLKALFGTAEPNSVVEPFRATAVEVGKAD